MHASQLYADFITWGYKTPVPARAGKDRRVKREAAAKKARDTAYSSTPSHPPSRQVLRRAAHIQRKSA